MLRVGKWRKPRTLQKPSISTNTVHLRTFLCYSVFGAQASEGGHRMHVTAVDSTTLATVAYDKARGLLQLEFRSRAIYQYFGVAAAVHEGLLGAASKGSYFNRFIRGRFPYSLVSDGQGGVRPGSLSQSADDRGLPWHGR